MARIVRRWAALSGFLIVAVLLICLFLPHARGTGDNAATVFDEDGYNQLLQSTSSNLDSLAATFDSERWQWSPIYPGSSFTFWQDASQNPLPFAPAAFPAEFVQGLTGIDSGGVTLYPVRMLEDTATRYILLFNAQNELIGSLPPPTGYNWQAAVMQQYPAQFPAGLSAEEQQERLAALDPARIGLTFYLIRTNDLVAWCTYPAEAEVDASASANIKPFGGQMQPASMDWTGGSVSDIIFTAIGAVSNGVAMTIAYPDDFTNRLDIFVSTVLQSHEWALADTIDVSDSQNWVTWTDTGASSISMRFYAAGNAGLDVTGDSDGDGLQDAREIYLYHTNPSSSDTDGDGVSDYDEVMIYRTDPNNSDTTRPTVTITSPPNGWKEVWIP